MSFTKYFDRFKKSNVGSQNNRLQKLARTAERDMNSYDDEDYDDDYDDFVEEEYDGAVGKKMDSLDRTFTINLTNKNTTTAQTARVFFPRASDYEGVANNFGNPASGTITPAVPSGTTGVSIEQLEGKYTGIKNYGMQLKSLIGGAYEIKHLHLETSDALQYANPLVIKDESAFGGAQDRTVQLSKYRSSKDFNNTILDINDLRFVMGEDVGIEVNLRPSASLTMVFTVSKAVDATNAIDGKFQVSAAPKKTQKKRRK